tara:strand:+ start:544 stop:795 length:252 start_codon:yes stop_codon:yes gene_type:complete
MSIPNTITIRSNKKTELDKLFELNQDLNKSNAVKNTEILLNVLEILERLTDRIENIDLNNKEIYLYIKKKQELEKESKQGWFT